MAVRITVGPSVPGHSSAGDEHVEVPPAGSIALPQLLDELGIPFRDSEGALLVFMNGILVSKADLGELVLKDGDHLSLHRMLSGG